MTMPWIYLALSIWGALFTLNALAPIRRPAPLAVVSFFAGWLTSELALHHILIQTLGSVAFIVFGALGAWPGWLGLGLSVLSWVGLFACHRLSQRAENRIHGALLQGLGADYTERVEPELAHFTAGFPPSWLAMPFPVRHRETVCERNRVYHTTPEGVRLTLDIHQRRDTPRDAPILVYIHGGAWVIGYRRYQGLPLLKHMAAHGWLCISVGYRLSPRATFPDHIIDVKRAIAWVRKHAAELGGDPDFICVAGNSAGGHLAALTALTPGVERFQPELPGVDTRVQAAMCFYGVYDFTNRYQHWRGRSFQRVLERLIIKRRFNTDRDAFEDASPMHWVNDDAPPFLLFHGDRDSLVPVEEARRFHGLLEDLSDAPVCYAEIPGAQHAYEIFPSTRTAHTLMGAERFLAYCLSRHLESAGEDAPVRRWLAAR